MLLAWAFVFATIHLTGPRARQGRPALSLVDGPGCAVVMVHVGPPDVAGFPTCHWLGRYARDEPGGDQAGVLGGDQTALVVAGLVPGVGEERPQLGDVLLAEEVLDAEPQLEGGVVERWAERPITKFERKGLAKDRLITDLAYRRVT